jgi:hypothetical protein
MSKGKDALKATKVTKGHFSAAVANEATGIAITLFEAERLLASDITNSTTGSSDPVCFVWCGYEGTTPNWDDYANPQSGIQLTKTIYSTLDPKWNETLFFPIEISDMHALLDLKFMIRVRDEDINVDPNNADATHLTYDELGVVEFDVKSLNIRAIKNTLVSKPDWFKLKEIADMSTTSKNILKKEGRLKLQIKATVMDKDVQHMLEGKDGAATKKAGGAEELIKQMLELVKPSSDNLNNTLRSSSSSQSVAGSVATRGRRPSSAGGNNSRSQSASPSPIRRSADSPVTVSNNHNSDNSKRPRTAPGRFNNKLRNIIEENNNSNHVNAEYEWEGLENDEMPKWDADIDAANANTDDNGTVLMDTDEVLDKLNNVSKKIKAANDEVDHPIGHHDDVEAYIHNKLSTKKGSDAFMEDEPELLTLSNPPNSNNKPANQTTPTAGNSKQAPAAINPVATTSSKSATAPAAITTAQAQAQPQAQTHTQPPPSQIKAPEKPDTSADAAPAFEFQLAPGDCAVAPDELFEDTDTKPKKATGVDALKDADKSKSTSKQGEVTTGPAKPENKPSAPPPNTTITNSAQQPPVDSRPAVPVVAIPSPTTATPSVTAAVTATPAVTPMAPAAERRPSQTSTRGQPAPSAIPAAARSSAPETITDDFKHKLKPQRQEVQPVSTAPESAQAQPTGQPPQGNASSAVRALRELHQANLPAATDTKTQTDLNADPNDSMRALRELSWQRNDISNLLEELTRITRAGMRSLATRTQDIEEQIATQQRPGSASNAKSMSKSASKSSVRSGGSNNSGNNNNSKKKTKKTESTDNNEDNNVEYIGGDENNNDETMMPFPMMAAGGDMALPPGEDEDADAANIEEDEEEADGVRGRDKSKAGSKSATCNSKGKGKKAAAKGSGLAAFKQQRKQEQSSFGDSGGGGGIHMMLKMPGGEIQSKKIADLPTQPAVHPDKPVPPGVTRRDLLAVDTEPLPANNTSKQRAKEEDEENIFGNLEHNSNLLANSRQWQTLNGSPVSAHQQLQQQQSRQTQSHHQPSHQLGDNSKQRHKKGIDWHIIDFYLEHNDLNVAVQQVLDLGTYDDLNKLLMNTTPKLEVCYSSYRVVLTYLIKRFNCRYYLLLCVIAFSKASPSC